MFLNILTINSIGSDPGVAFAIPRSMLPVPCQQCQFLTLQADEINSFCNFTHACQVLLIYMTTKWCCSHFNGQLLLIKRSYFLKTWMLDKVPVILSHNR